MTWKYLVVKSDVPLDHEYMRDIGERGWELASMIQIQSGGFVFYFKKSDHLERAIRGTIEIQLRDPPGGVARVHSSTEGAGHP